MPARPLSTALISASLFAAAGPAGADQMMSVCAPEIANQCSGVREGRGRISACLFAQQDRLSPACGAEVAEVTSRPAFRSRIPSGASSSAGSQQEAALQAECTAGANPVCAGTPAANGRLLACVYARSEQVSPSCWAAAETTLK